MCTRILICILVFGVCIAMVEAVDIEFDVNDVSHKRLNLWMWIFMKKVMDFVYFY